MASSTSTNSNGETRAPFVARSFPSSEVLASAVPDSWRSVRATSTAASSWETLGYPDDELCARHVPQLP